MEETPSSSSSSGFEKLYDFLEKREHDIRVFVKQDCIERILRKRNVELPFHDHFRLLKCRDLEQLDVWLEAAIVAYCAPDVFLALAPPEPDTP